MCLWNVWKLCLDSLLSSILTMIIISSSFSQSGFSLLLLWIFFGDSMLQMHWVRISTLTHHINSAINITVIPFWHGPARFTSDIGPHYGIVWMQEIRSWFNVRLCVFAAALSKCTDYEFRWWRTEVSHWWCTLNGFESDQSNKFNILKTSKSRNPSTDHNFTGKWTKLIYMYYYFSSMDKRETSVDCFTCILSRTYHIRLVFSPVSCCCYFSVLFSHIALASIVERERHTYSHILKFSQKKATMKLKTLLTFWSVLFS